LFLEAEIFKIKKNVFSECRKCYFRGPNFKNFLGRGPFGSFSPPLKNP
jgi:hypothetical protein